MTKESASKIAQVLNDAQVALRSVTSERDQLAMKCAAYERRAEATKVATLLHEKGVDLDTDLPELVQRMEKEADAGRLPEIARAAEMIGPNMSFGTTNHDEAVGYGSDAFTNFLVGSVG